MAGAIRDRTQTIRQQARPKGRRAICMKLSRAAGDTGLDVNSPKKAAFVPLSAAQDSVLSTISAAVPEQQWNSTPHIFLESKARAIVKCAHLKMPRLNCRGPSCA